MTYTPPLAEQRFVLRTIADIAGLATLEAFAGASPDMVDAILDEAGRLAAGTFAPLNRIGDTEGARWSADGVTLPAGFREAYATYVANGWAGLGADPAHGGQGLPFVLACAVQEQLTSANMAFSLCMMLSQGAIAAFAAHGSQEQQGLYLTKLVSGEWTGTMNLTEPQAGSDVGALRATATPADDGSYRIAGTKIYITWGEHDVADNIVHLVLARLPQAPPGTKGISLFVVPKFLPQADGTPGTRNDVRCVSIEHKLGIHASPTCTMSFGDEGNCVGWLVGAPHAGMRAMFTMMNHARINVGLQGVAIAERAYQAALGYARDRVQGAGAIVAYPDVRRMLMTMRALTQAARALTYYTAAAADRAHADPDAQAAAAAQALADLLTPVTKAWATDVGVTVANIGIQVFGGMGYVEETGAAQHLRDARIAPIYEGTNGIQAMDLIGRKLGLGGGAPVARLLDAIAHTATGLDDSLADLRAPLADALAALRTATDAARAHDPRDAGAAASPYLRLMALVVGGWLLCIEAQAAAAQRAAGDGDAAFLTAKIATARFFATQLMPEAASLLPAITASADALFAIDEDQLAS